MYVTTIVLIEDMEKKSSLRDLIDKYLTRSQLNTINGCIERPTDTHQLNAIKDADIFFIDADYIIQNGSGSFNYVMLDHHIKIYQNKIFYFFSFNKNETFFMIESLKNRNTIFCNIQLQNDTETFKLFSDFKIKFQLNQEIKNEYSSIYTNPEKKLKKKKKQNEQYEFMDFEDTVHYIKSLYQNEKWKPFAWIRKKRMTMVELYMLAAIVYSGRHNKRKKEVCVT